MKSTVVDESLSSFKPMYCSREYQTSTRLIQQYEKSTLKAKYNNQYFRTLKGTRHKTRRRQVTGIQPMLITPVAASPTIIQNVAATPGMHVTIMTQVQENLAAMAVLDTQAMVEQELSVPETVLPVTTANNESQLGASYLNNCFHQVVPNNNVSMCSLDSFAQENLKTLLNERLSDEIYSTYRETFSNTYLHSVSESLPKVNAYNKEIAKVVQEINMKYQLQLFAVPLLQVNIDLSHQQAEIDRLMQVAQQWSAEGLCQYNQTPANYNKEKFSSNAGRGRSVRPCNTPNMSPVPHNRMS